MKIIIKKSDYLNKRIDLVIPLIDSSFSRSQVQKLIKDNLIKVNDEIVKANYLVKLKDVIEIEAKKENKLKGENIPLNIVYEDKDLLVINKQRGLVVHPGSGNHEHTLVNALIYHIKDLSSVDPARPGIVHRIDKDTSGLLVVAKNNVAHRALAKQLENHSMHREYQALVKGIIKEDKGKIIAPIGRDKSNPLKMCVDTLKGKTAESSFKVIKRFKDATLVDIKLKQGRTHQIRVHFEYINHPVIGDPLYGRDNRHQVKDGQILHAYKITFTHPSAKKKMSFTSPLPEYFLKALKLFC
ncbi:MAG: RluA family pseudouridine synthase [Bacilli bacterium]|nr:RluA family pseudouridine synthase [Bacilli bacterium]